MPRGTAKRVLLVDDNERVRRGIANALAGHCDICGEAENGAEAVEMVRELMPDIVLLDLSLPVMSGSEAAQTIQSLSPNTRIVFISVDDSPPVARLVRSAGAEGFISKNCSGRAFAQAVDAIPQHSQA